MFPQFLPFRTTSRLTACIAGGTIGAMLRAGLALVVFMSAGFAVDARAVDVAVVDAEGRPAARATVLCLDPPSAAPSPVVDGRASIAGSCRRVRCDAGDALPGEAAISGEAPRCQLQPATVVACELPASSADPGLEARLVPSSGSAAGVSSKVSARFTLPAVKPGRYALELARKTDGWTCRADLGPLGPGRQAVTPVWREPSVVAVRVKGPDGKPAAGVPVRAWGRRPVAARRGLSATPIGTWDCAVSSATPRTTDATGLTQLSLDLKAEALVVAGEWKDARGIAFTTVDRAPSQPVPLTLAAPVRLRAKLEDDKGRPAACDATVTELPADLSWLVEVLAGATVKTTCDPQGILALGPLTSAAFTLELRPRIGMPIRIPVDPPAPGATADLGILRVRNGESFRVVVQDDAGRPVQGAKVKLRGSAGIVLTVAGTSADDGGVDLSGLPKNAIVALDILAKGFLPAHEAGLELDASPYVVKLARGAAVSGSVQDADGVPVEGARVSLAGETNDRRDETTDAAGAFAFDGVADGGWRIIATAAGFADSEPVTAEVREHRSVERMTIALRPADGISGHVVDAAGTPVAGATVRLVASRDRDDRAPLAEATSGTEGTYQLRASPPADAWLVAMKAGFGPCALRAPVPSARGDVLLALTESASLVVHIPPGARTSRRLRVRDGAGIGRTVPAGGTTELAFSDLAPGRGSAGLIGGSERDVTLTARETAEVTLDAASAIEGRVTFDGAPSARTHVTALYDSGEGRMEERGGAFTDERGRYRIDGIAGDSYRLAAVGEDGRAETTLELADGETAHVDFALRSVRLIVNVVDGAGGKPLAGVPLEVVPGGKLCNSSMGTSQWGDPGELGFEVSIGANGCLTSRTDGAGVARLSLAAPGSFDLDVGDESYEPYKQAISLVEGTSTKRVALTRKPDKSGEKPHVFANLRTDPPGLQGTVWCRSAGNTNSSSPVSGRVDCGTMNPGPGDIVFLVEGFGRGRAAFDVPQSGELVVDCDVSRGGTVVAPTSQDSEVQPTLVDGSGFAWSAAAGNGGIPATLEDVPSIGRAWVFRDVPPGTYTVTVAGKARSAVPLAPGGTAYAN